MNLNENITTILRWNKFHALAMLIAASVSLVTSNTLILSIASLISFGIFLYTNKSTWQKFPFGGYANWITTIRLLIIHSFIAFWPILPYSFFVIGLIVFVVLDGLDGKIARKYNQSTIFGEYYDMELDALFVLFICIFLYLKGISGMWILLPGALRYLFVIYTWIFSSIPKKDDKQRFATIIAGVFFTMLLVSIAFQNPIQDILLKLSGFAIVVSFGISFYRFHFGQIEAQKQHG